MFKNSVLGWLTLAAATFSFVSCNMDQEMGNDLEEFVFEAGQVAPPETKTHMDPDELADEWVWIKWDQGDKVGVFGSWTRNAPFTALSSGENPSFSGSVTRGDKVKYAYYPYSQTAVNYRSIPVTIQGTQQFSDGSNLYGNDIVASNSVKTVNGKTVFDFEYMTSYVGITMDLSSFEGLLDDEVILGYTLQNMENRHLTGSYTMNIANLTMTEQSGSNEVTVNLPGDFNVYDGRLFSTASVYPSTKIGDRMKLIIETNYHTISLIFKSTSTMERGWDYYYNFPLGNMDRYSNFINVLNKNGANANEDGLDACKRFLDWQSGETFNVAGKTISKATTDLTPVYVPGELIVNNAQLQNSIVFVEPGATLFLGSNAKLGNTIIMSNDPDEKADVIGLMTAAASADPTYLALYDINIEIPATVAGAGLNELYVEGCNINADYGTIIDLFDFDSPTFGTLSLVGNTFHPVDLMIPEFEFAAGAEYLTFDNVTIKDNVFINVKGMGGSMLNAAKINNIDIQNNHYFYGSKFTGNFSVLSSEDQPTSVVSKNNTYYVGSKGTGVITSYSVPSGEGYMAAAKSNPFSDYDPSEGYYEYSSNIYVGSAYTLDGETKPVTMTSKSATLPHVPSGANVEYFYLPGVTVSESGSWASAKTVTFSTEDASDTYTFTLPDYVSGPVQALAGDSSAWTLAWADEFNGSAWNGDAWSRIPVTNHGGIEFQDPDDASLAVVENGALVTWATGNDASTYAAGGVYGKDKKSFNLNMNGVEGRIDVAVKVSDAQGFWPSIWMLPADQAIDAGTVANGEIDIFSHYHSENIVNQILSTAAGRYSCTPSYTDRDQYHVFTVTVTNEAINMYVDGALTKSVTKAAAGASGWPWDANEYYLNIAAQIGGWVGNPGANALPAHMDVDYVRYMVK